MNFLINFDKVSFKVLLVVILMDIIFGILRAIKEKKLNSTIGIDGIIRKTGMLIAVVFVIIIDNIINFDFIGFIPTELKEVLNFDTVGINDLFSILFIIFEILSIFKNMVLCKLPIPIKLQNFCERILEEYTNEIKVEGDNNE